MRLRPPTLADIAPRSLASSCDKHTVCRREHVLTARPPTVFSFTLDRNEINKITQAHRVAKTGRPAGGRPVTIRQIERSIDRTIWPNYSEHVIVKQSNLLGVLSIHRFSIVTFCQT